MIGVRLAERLVNLDRTGRWSTEEVRAALDAGLVRVIGLDEEDLVGLRTWAARLGSAFEAQDPATRCEAINALLDDAVRHVHLVIHDALPAHLHFAAADADLLQRVRATTAGGIAIFGVETGASRMGACSRQGCRRVFADTSRAGRRAYCSTRCANGSAVRRYRERRTTPIARPR